MSIEVWMFQCPTCEGFVVIPPGSPLEKSLYPQDQPTDTWPIDYFCLRCEIVMQRIPRDTSLAEVKSLLPKLEPASLWVIEGACGRENCGRPYAIYSKQPDNSSASNVAGTLLTAKPPYQCKAGHPCEMTAGAMTARRL